MNLLVRTTLIAASASLLSVLILTVFLAQVMHLTTPPDDFASWPAPKKEAYLYEHRSSTVRGVDLLELWIHEPGDALQFMGPEVVQAFSLAWVAAFFGGLWQARAKHR